MKVINLLIKPASSDCNLRCKYCFYHDLSDNRSVKSHGHMKYETLEELIKKAFNEAEVGVILAFQGGEPTLVGLEFYKHLIRLVNEYNKKNLSVSYSIQTNGLLLNNEWCSFLKTYNFLVGISLDGYKEAHDLLRYDNQKNGTFVKVLKSIELLKRYHLEFNILTVINQINYNHALKIYTFYKKHNLKYLQFIPCLSPLDDVNNELAITSNNYYLFLDTLFQLWYKDVLTGEEISIRYFDNLVGMVLGYQAQSCDLKGTCSANLIVESNGDIYPCDFYVIDNYRIGNIKINSIQEIIRSNLVEKFINESTIIDDDCIRCNYYSLCMGGCKRHRQSPYISELSKNYFCDAYYKFLDKNIYKLKKLASYFINK